MAEKPIKLDPQHRQELIAELEVKTGYSLIYLKSRTDEELMKIRKERG